MTVPCLRCGDPFSITAKYISNYCHECKAAHDAGKWP